MAVDEIYFHRRRGLSTWEIWSHPIDTLAAFICVLFLLNATATVTKAWIFVGLAALSALLCTKDEFVHLENCERGEQWTHAVLFLLHPTVFFCGGLSWWWGTDRAFLLVQAMLISLCLVFQIGYWGVPWLRERRKIEP
jgi:hypothetical protein